MLLLVADIFRHGWSIRDAHAESAISILPGEAASVFVHPFGRVGFNKLNSLGQRNGWRQVKKNMRVVRHAVDRNWSHFLVATDATHSRGGKLVNVLLRTLFSPQSTLGCVIAC